jgi:hypothetical protein
MKKSMHLLADRQANAIYKKPLWLTGLFPTWIPGTRAALFHGERQVTAKRHRPCVHSGCSSHASIEGVPYSMLQGGNWT